MDKLGVVPDQPEITVYDACSTRAVVVPGHRLQTAAVKMCVVSKERLRKLEAADKVAFSVNVVIAEAISLSALMQVCPTVGEIVFMSKKL